MVYLLITALVCLLLTYNFMYYQQQHSVPILISPLFAKEKT